MSAYSRRGAGSRSIPQLRTGSRGKILPLPEAGAALPTDPLPLCLDSISSCLPYPCPATPIVPLPVHNTVACWEALESAKHMRQPGGGAHAPAEKSPASSQLLPWRLTAVHNWQEDFPSHQEAELPGSNSPSHLKAHPHELSSLT